MSEIFTCFVHVDVAIVVHFCTRVVFCDYIVKRACWDLGLRRHTRGGYPSRFFVAMRPTCNGIPNSYVNVLIYIDE